MTEWTIGAVIDAIADAVPEREMTVCGTRRTTFAQGADRTRRLANFLRVLTMEAQTIARACGKAHVTHLEPEDLVAITIEAAAMARIPLAGTNWIPGQ